MTSVAQTQLIRVHLGCGLITPSGWVNVDGSWNARLAKYPILRRACIVLGVLPANKASVKWNSNVLSHNVTKPLPFPDSSASSIYSSHLIEHLYFEEGQRLLRECFRVLAPQGVLRLVVPDLREIINEYLEEGPACASTNGNNGFPPADRVNQRLLMWPAAPPDQNIVLRLYNSWKSFHEHKWMYDSDSLQHHMRNAGFVAVEQMGFNQSRITGIEDIEDPTRVLNGAGICVEGVKPV